MKKLIVSTLFIILISPCVFAQGVLNYGAVNLSSGASGSLQAAQEPAHTGDMTNTAASLATSVVAIRGVATTTPTGTGAVVYSISPTALTGNWEIGGGQVALGTNNLTVTNSTALQYSATNPGATASLAVFSSDTSELNNAAGMAMSAGGTGNRGTCYLTGITIGSGSSQAVLNCRTSSVFGDIASFGGAGVGIFTDTPMSALSVNGGVAIGTTYAASNAAGNNNLIVQSAIAIGTSSVSAGQFTVNNASTHAGQATCWTTGGAIGYCTSIVGAGGACTCTGI